MRVSVGDDQSRFLRGPMRFDPMAAILSFDSGLWMISRNRGAARSENISRGVGMSWPVDYTKRILREADGQAIALKRPPCANDAVTSSLR